MGRLDIVTENLNAFDGVIVDILTFLRSDPDTVFLRLRKKFDQGTFRQDMYLSRELLEDEHFDVSAWIIREVDEAADESQKQEANA